MSVVTDIILITEIDDRALGEEKLKYGLKKVDEHAGGDKAMQCDVFMSAMSHVDLEEVVSWFNSIQWESSYCAQLFVKGEYDDLFSVFSIN